MWVQATKENIKIGMKARVRKDVFRPQYDWGDVRNGDVGIITKIDPIKPTYIHVDFPLHKNWTAYTSEMEVDVETKSKLEQLEETIAKAQQEIKELREVEEKAKRPHPKLRRGQVWKRIQSNSYYIVNREEVLINLNSGDIWDNEGEFGGYDHEITYVGEAKDLVQIKD